MSTGIKRRSFLKIAAGGVSAVVATRLLSSLVTAEERAGDSPWVDRCTGKKIEGLASTCTGCGAGCGVIAYSRSGQLLKIGGNHAHPTNKGTLCLVGQAGLYCQYNPERTLKPLMRSGKRGGGGWTETSWDEALNMVATRLGRNRGKVVVETRGGSSVVASKAFVDKFGGRLMSHDRIISANREAALGRTFGARYDWPDIANASYILNFGSDPFESDPFGLGIVRQLAEFRATGGRTKLVTFDPRLSSTAGRSDEWFPLMPGTDTALALAMAGVIIHEGLHDEAFINAHTNLSVSALTAHLSSYTPATASRITGLDEQDIKRIAVEYAKADRGCILTGGGISNQPGGTNNERAVRLLSIITGKINKPGCNIIPKSDGWDVASELPEAFHARVASGADGAGVYILHSANPAYSSPNAAAVRDALKDESRFPFIVSMDTDISDTGIVADMILPIATYLEEFSVELSPGPGGDQVVGWRQPALMPAGEALPYVEILSRLASAAGEDMGYSDSEEYADSLLGRLNMRGSAAELASKGFVFESGQFPLAGSHGQIRTPSGRIMAQWEGEARFPSYEAVVDLKEMGAHDFVLIAFSPGGYREGFTENNLILKEMFHDSRLFMNSETGRVMGLKNWDRVSVTSPTDKLEATVMLSPGIHPKVVTMARGNGHEGYGKIEKGEKFKSDDPFTEPIWWERDGAPGVNPSRLVGFNIDKQSGGQGSMLSRVTVIKTDEAKHA